MTTRIQKASQGPRADVLAMWGGVLFSLLFTGLIWLAGERLAAFPRLPDQGALWYEWKLAVPTAWTRATAWGLYLLHQFAIWGLMWHAQRSKLRYTSGLHRVNVLALGVNALFVVLHFVQTHLWYDGLAQDVSILSSQGSVIVLLVWVLLMENSRRGIFFGKRLPIRQEIIRAARTYHGYFFAWAIIYTFWYHPMEATSGHLIGFVYTMLLMLQGSLFFTRIHVNRWWTLVQEIAVLFHGTLVAVMQGKGMWPMFFFGFAAIFIVTQMHGLGLSRRVRWFIGALYGAAVLWVYNGRGWDKLNEIIRIPVIDYLLVIILALLIGLGVWVARRLRGPRESAPPRQEAPQWGD